MTLSNRGKALMTEQIIKQLESEVEQSVTDQMAYAKETKHHKADQEFGRQKGLTRAIELLQEELTKPETVKEPEQKTTKGKKATEKQLDLTEGAEQ